MPPAAAAIAGAVAAGFGAFAAAGFATSAILGSVVVDALSLAAPVGDIAVVPRQAEPAP